MKRNRHMDGSESSESQDAVKSPQKKTKVDDAVDTTPPAYAPLDAADVNQLQAMGQLGLSDQGEIAWKAELDIIREQWSFPLRDVTADDQDEIAEQREDKRDHRRPCQYAEKCYRRNPQHFGEFSHNHLVKDALAKIKSMAEAIKSSIRKKADWPRKICNGAIAQKYHDELVGAGLVTEEAFMIARFDLLHEALEISPKKKAEEPTHEHILAVDGLIDEDTRLKKFDLKRLEKTFDAIANGPVKDYHPNTDGKVQDLVHPSLYPYIKGISFVLPKEKKQPTDGIASPTKKKKQKPVSASLFRVALDTFGNYLLGTSSQNIAKPKDEEEDESSEDNEAGTYTGSRPKLDLWGRKFEVSKFQWLPAEFEVTSDRGVVIKSYINNLDGEKYSALYGTIAKVFGKCVPYFEKILEDKLTDRRLQVIVKACNYILKPGQLYEGNWHVEGMSHERIVASAIYYYSTSPNVRGPGLAFRRMRDEEVDWPQIDEYHMDDDLSDPEQFEGLKMNIPLGTAPTPMNRILFFTNDMQHKVEPLYIEPGSTEVGKRKILCFFLIDPTRPVKSTASVPPQQWSMRKKFLYPVMNQLSRQILNTADRPDMFLPQEVIDYILDFAESGFTLEMAKQYRLELMRERKFVVDEENQEYEREFSLCEH